MTRISDALREWILFAKISTYADERSARLAGIGLMLLSIFMFSFGDALGKFMVATYSVGQLLWLRACAALLVLSPMIWRQRAAFPRLERPWLQLLRVMLSTARSRGVLSRDRLSAARRRHHLLPGVSDLRHRAVGDRAARARRLAALERGPDRLLRRADRAAAVGADRELAGADRARRQPVVCGADADHPLAARDAGYRAGVDAIRRHVHARRGDVAVRLGHAEPGSLGLFAAAGCISVSALLCVNRSLKLAPASVVVPYQYSMIVWAVMFGYVVFGDVPSMATIVGAAIIIGAGLYIFLRERDLGRGGDGGQSAGVTVIRRGSAGLSSAPSATIVSASRGALDSTAPRRTAPVLQRRPDAARQPEAIDRGRRSQRLEAMQLDAAPLEAAFLQDVARRRDWRRARRRSGARSSNSSKVKSITARAASVPKPWPQCSTPSQ